MQAGVSTYFGNKSVQTIIQMSFLQHSEHWGHDGIVKVCSLYACVCMCVSSTLCWCNMETVIKGSCFPSVGWCLLSETEPAQGQLVAKLVWVSLVVFRANISRQLACITSRAAASESGQQPAKVSPGRDSTNIEPDIPFFSAIAG